MIDMLCAGPPPEIHPLTRVVAALHVPGRPILTRDTLGPHIAPTSHYRPHGGQFLWMM